MQLKTQPGDAERKDKKLVALLGLFGGDRYNPNPANQTIAQAGGTFANGLKAQVDGLTKRKNTTVGQWFAFPPNRGLEAWTPWGGGTIYLAGRPYESSPTGQSAVYGSDGHA